MISNCVEGLSSFFDSKLAERGITKPTAIQSLVIPHILQNKSVIFRSETGTGKTFAYLLPVLQGLLTDPEKKALILAPTLELASQIKKEADYLLSGIQGDAVKIRTGLFTGAMNLQRQIDSVKKEKTALIIGTTNRLVQLARMRKLRLKIISYVVLDETDRLLSDELIDSTKDILSFIDKDRCIIACSATISKKNKTILQGFCGQDFIILESDDNEILREKITHLAIWSEERRQIETLCSLLQALQPKKVLCFTNRSDQVNNITEKLLYHRFKAAALYSGIDKMARKGALDDFRAGKVHLLVSTDLAARGLDIEGVSHVICIGVPPNSNGYLHRAGRTARAGKIGMMISIGAEHEMRRLLAIEKHLKIIITPKIVYKGSLLNPDDEIFAD